MTESKIPRFSEIQKQEEYRIWVEDYDYDYFWGIGVTTFMNKHSLTIRGKWRPIPIGKDMSALINIDQTDDDPTTRDDDLFHEVVGDQPKEFYDSIRVGRIEIGPKSILIYVELPRSAILALLTMLSAEGQKEVFVLGSTPGELGVNLTSHNLHSIGFSRSPKYPDR